jgi:hypothetical protein
MWLLFFSKTHVFLQNAAEVLEAPFALSSVSSAASVQIIVVDAR